MPRAIRLLHISDLHFGAEDLKRIEAVHKLVAKTYPDLICITGDLVDWPWKKNFIKAKKFIDSLDVPPEFKFIVPGNHDTFFRAPNLRRFCKVFKTPTEYRQHVAIDNIDVCIFGIDSTCFAIREFNNTGKFSRRSQRALKQAIEDLSKELGEEDYKESAKIFLIHHHPLPTNSPKAEGMLYFKNSGIFLDTATKEGIDLILHGHRHEPTYYALNYDQAGPDRTIVVLSAGCATKKLGRTADVHKLSQVHLVELYRDEEARKQKRVSCYNYDDVTEEFWESRVIPSEVPKTAIQKRKIRTKYVVRANTWNMFVENVEFLWIRERFDYKKFEIDMGVDQKSPVCTDFDALKLQVYQDNQPIPEENVHRIKDEPREKRVDVTLLKPVTDQGSEIKWSYEWPGGFANLKNGKKDVGIIQITDRIEEVRIEVEVEEPNPPIRDFRVLYRDKFDPLYLGNPRKRGFSIPNPINTNVAVFDLRID